MPWSRNEPDPLDALRRKLAEQERQLAELKYQLEESLRQSEEPPAAGVLKPSEPPVWRLEEENHDLRGPAEPTPARKRNLARQRQRDMILFFIIVGIFLVVVIIAVWVAYVRNAGPNTGA